MRSRLIVVTAGIALLAVVGCARINGDAPTPAQTTVVMNASYRHYDTVEQLGQAADLVIRGTALSSEVKELDSAITPTSDDPVLNPGGPVVPAIDVWTVYSFAVTDCYKGCATAGTVVKVKVRGGTLDGVQYVATGAPSFQVNKKYILFLVAYGDRPASLVNPVQAAYSDGVDKDGNYIGLSQDSDLKFPPGQMKKLFDA